ncbi:MAG: hypothetical protein IPM73_12945 [Betaproteobacteria bacterium]|nr:hypothetical protein [Betaproteobacteria bacterium]
MPAHQPVGAGITQQGVVAAVAVGVPDAFLGQIDDFSGGEAGDIGALPIFGLGGGAADAAAESIAHRVGDEAGGLGFLGLAVLGEAAAGQDFVAPLIRPDWSVGLRPMAVMPSSFRVLSSPASVMPSWSASCQTLTAFQAASAAVN